MIASEESIQQLLSGISSGKIKSLADITSALKDIHGSYDDDAWSWTTGILAERFGIDMDQITAEQLMQLLDRWESMTIKLDKMILNDAAKEFDESSRIGFGIDGDAEVARRDFEAVRGRHDENKFIIGINEEMSSTEQKAAELKAMISSLKD